MPYGDGRFTGVEAEQQWGRSGIRLASEFITGPKPQGTDADPWPGSAIQAAIDDLPAAFGMVFVPGGIWDIATGLTGIPAGIVLQGAGFINTTLRGPASGVCITVGDVDNVTIRDMRIEIGATAGAGILIDGPTDGTGNHGVYLRDLSFADGQASGWAIELRNVIEFGIVNILCGTAPADIFNSNGILFDNTGGSINYGDGFMENVQIFLNANSTTGVRLHGEESGGGNIVGQIAFSHLIVSTLQGSPTGMIGLQIINSEYHTFHHSHFEGVNTAIDIQGQVGGGPFARFNTFLGGLISSDISMDAGTRANMFVGGAYNGTITDLNTSTGLPNTFYGHSPVGLLRLETGRVDLKNRSGQQCITARLNNRTGLTSVVGRLAKQASSDNDGFEEMTGTDTDNWVGLIHEAVANAQAGRVAIYGIVNADFSGAVTRGDFVIHDTANPGQVVSNGTTLPATGLLVGIATQTLGGAGLGRILLSRA